MGLINLLTSGHAFDGGPDKPNDFKMRQENLLPKFAPANRPISLAPPAKPKAPVLVTGSLFDYNPQRLLGEQAAGAAIPVPNPIGSAAPSRIPRVPAPPEPSRSWKERLFGVRSRRRQTAGAVQSEWALGNVTVVRNTLEESDLEIVPRLEPVTPARQPGFLSRWISRFTRAGRVDQS